MVEYYKNLDLADIKYFCEEDLVWKTEQWKSIPGYEGIYQASDLGRVKGLDRISADGRRLKCKILKTALNNTGYIIAGLCKHCTMRTFNVHQLVTMAFLSHKPDNTCDLVVNHINFIRCDNRLINLEIITFRENGNKKHLKSSSQYTGVCWDKNNNRWRSTISLNGKKIYLGNFKNEIDASNAYQKALLEIIN